MVPSPPAAVSLRTVEVTVTNSDEQSRITLPKGMTNSIVEVVPGSPDVVVGNLEKVFHDTSSEAYTEDDKELVEKGGIVEIKFTVEQVAEDKENPIHQSIQQAAGSAIPALYLELELEKTVTDENGNLVSDSSKTLSESNVLLKSVIPLPADLQGKYQYSVIRVHEGDTHTLTTSQNRDGEYIVVNSDKTVLTIYAKKYSTYAIAYSDYVASSDSNSSSGGGGGDDWEPIYPPIIRDTEYGNVTVSPEAPGRGDKVTITPTPESGSILDSLIVTAADGTNVELTDNGDGTYTFTQPTGKVTITAIFKPANSTVADPSLTGVKGLLNTDDHIEYMDGYTTGLFGPGDNITRAQVAQVFYNLLRDQTVYGAPYDDVPSDAWYAKAVSTMRALGIMAGVGGNRFEPDRPITRAEFTVTAMRFAMLPTGGGNMFSDMNESDWYYAQIIGAVQYGWISGYPDGTFKPNAPITRAEATKIINNMLGRSADKDFIDTHLDVLQRFPDVDDRAYWAFYDIMEAVNPHNYKKDNNIEEWTGLE